MKHLNIIFLGSLSLLFSIASFANPSIHTFSNCIFDCNYFCTTKAADAALEDCLIEYCMECLDDDNDGICNNKDCAPQNSKVPAKPGTPCNDNNEYTANDIILDDGCTCIGTPTQRDTPIMITAGPDRKIYLNEKTNISVEVLQHNTCITTSCNKKPAMIAHFDMNALAEQNKNQAIGEQCELINPVVNNTVCAGIVSSNFYVKDGAYFCPSAPRSKSSGNALALEMPMITAFEDNHPNALRFEITLNPDTDVSRITNVEFMEKAPKKYISISNNSKKSKQLNNYPTKYGVRILKGGQQIYKSIDMPTGRNWLPALFDFTNEPIFEVTARAVITVEILAYSPIGNGGTMSVWNLDDIEVYGDCCTSTSFKSSKYNWSTGERTNNITVSQPGTYGVTVTDCNGTTATDEVIVSLKEENGIMAQKPTVKTSSSKKEDQ